MTEAVVSATGAGADAPRAARSRAQASMPKQRKPKQQASAQRQDAAPQAVQESTAHPSSPDDGLRRTSADDAAPRADEPGATGETQESDPAERPPIEPPRSWNAEARERWAKLDPDTQQYLLEQDRTASATIRKAQNDAAEKLKGLTAKEQAVEQARQHYEQALPQLLSVLQQQQAGEFADIRSIADVERLARESWPRYLQWDLAQKKIAAVQQEVHGAHLRQAKEKLQIFAAFARREDDLFIERIPELANETKMADLQSSAVATLIAIGFDEAELGAAWIGQKDVSLRDHRVQMLIRDASLWRDAQAKVKASTIWPVPPAQRPDASPPAGAAKAQDIDIQNLNHQLDNASGVDALRTAAHLVAAKRAAAWR